MAVQLPVRGKKYRAAIIGHTGHGDYGHRLRTVWNAFHFIDVVAVADPGDAGREKAMQRSSPKRGYRDYREMLDKESPISSASRRGGLTSGRTWLWLPRSREPTFSRSGDIMLIFGSGLGTSFLPVSPDFYARAPIEDDKYYVPGSTTVLAAKDRILGHHPVAAPYTSHSYYRRLKQGPAAADYQARDFAV